MVRGRRLTLGVPSLPRCHPCVQWDAYQASRGGDPSNSLDGGVWSSLTSLTNHSSSLTMPHNVLPGALNLPLTLAGAGRGT